MNSIPLIDPNTPDRFTVVDMEGSASLYDGDNQVADILVEHGIEDFAKGLGFTYYESKSLDDKDQAAIFCFDTWDPNYEHHLYLNGEKVFEREDTIRFDDLIEELELPIKRITIDYPDDSLVWEDDRNQGGLMKSLAEFMDFLETEDIPYRER